MEVQTRHLLKALLTKASALPDEQRQHLLDQIVTDDDSKLRVAGSVLDRGEAAESAGHDLTWDAWGDGQGAVGESVPEVAQHVSHYEILDKLGDGSIGVVFKARDTHLDRLVALKFLHPHLRNDKAARDRFIQEAKAISALDHPNVATIHEIGFAEPSRWNPDGHPYIVMAYYEGTTLRKLIDRGPLSVAECLDVACQTVQGLVAAHDRGVCHRDIKPSNVMVTDDGLVKIVDFGLAKMEDAGLTKTGTTMGSPAYMSPEQSRGDGVDHRTDIWSLGVLLYETLSGRRPFEGDYEAAVLYAILHKDPVPVGMLRKDLPSDLEAIVATCLSKNPDERYQTAKALLNSLCRVMEIVRRYDSDVAASRRPIRCLLPQYIPSL